MTKMKWLVVLLVSVVALLLAVPVVAQGELSLESLAERVQALTGRMDAMVERLDAAEALWGNAGSVDIGEGFCLTGRSGEQGMQEETVLKFQNQFGEWPDTDFIVVHAIAFNPDTGIGAIQYEETLPDRFVVEFWQGCEFMGSTAWWETDWDDPDTPFLIPDAAIDG